MTFIEEVDDPLSLLCVMSVDTSISGAESKGHKGARRVGKLKAHAQGQPGKKVAKVTGSGISQVTGKQGAGSEVQIASSDGFMLEKSVSQVCDRSRDARTSAGVGAAESSVLDPGVLANRGAQVLRFGTATEVTLSEDSDDDVDWRFGHGDHDYLGDLRNHGWFGFVDTEPKSGSSPAGSSH